MRRSTNLRFMSIAAAVLFASVALFSKSAFATPTYSNSQYATVNGYSYEYYSHAEVFGTTVDAGGAASCTHTNVPIGYIGIYSLLIGPDYTPVAATDWTYNDIVCAGLKTYASSSGVGTYCGRGFVRFYNGGGYNIYRTYDSPYVQIQSSNGLREDLMESIFDPWSKESPVLIQARGTNGSEGYIRYSDLGIDSAPASPKEAVASMGLQPEVRYIPVYGEDGAVIDEFPIYRGENNFRTTTI